MAEETDREEKILQHAQGLPPGPRRAAYLAEACGSDETLRREIEDLLAAGEEPASALQKVQDLAAAELPTLVKDGEEEDLDEPGDTISHYKLLQRIGEGGFGVVYLAEQTEPVERRVALKVIKAGMDTRSVIARFEAERQALAMMEHPNIARVLDAGSTDRGRPYFVMELVKGIPITDYCDQVELGTRQRLKLFQDVCSAVQHSHQKGIIHRDLKPSNVLVTLHGEEPVVKVIDFGVAKAIGHKLTEKTLFTAVGQMVGTPAYMSPEQAVISGLDIDTRSDIFSLGVLLYELLTGAPPFEAERLRSAGFEEMRRIIREEQPPRPSTRLRTLDEKTKLHVAARRHLTPAALRRQLHGDLDWIVMKALEKERSRRYDSVGGLAQDVQRHLDSEPVMAGPPSRVYQLRKFVGRHRGAVGAGLTIFLLLAVVAVLGVQLIIKSRNDKISELRTRVKWAAGFDSELRDMWDDESKPESVEIRSEARATLLGSPIPLAPDASRLVFAVYTQKSPVEMKDSYIRTVDYLERTMNAMLEDPVRIDFHIYRGYQALIDALVDREVSFARLGPASYVEAKNRDPGLQLAVIQDEENVGLIFARKDSGLRPLGSEAETIQSLALKNIALGNANSTLSSMWPKAKFVEAGVYARDLGEGSAHLGTHDLAVDGVIKGNFEAGAAKAAIVEKKGKGEWITLVKMRALNPPWVAAGHIERPVVDAFKASLLELDDADLLKKIHDELKGFMEPPGGDRYFDETREMIERAKQFGSLPSE